MPLGSLIISKSSAQLRRPRAGPPLFDDDYYRPGRRRQQLRRPHVDIDMASACWPRGRWHSLVGVLGSGMSALGDLGSTFTPASPTGVGAGQAAAPSRLISSWPFHITRPPSARRHRRLHRRASAASAPACRLTGYRTVGVMRLGSSKLSVLVAAQAKCVILRRALTRRLQVQDAPLTSNLYGRRGRFAPAAYRSPAAQHAAPTSST